VLDSEAVERHRIEGFLPVDDFLAQLDLGMGKLHFQQENYAAAEKQFLAVCESLPETAAAPEACYWAGVAAYKGSDDAGHLASTARALIGKYPDSVWARKASVWSR
jgi:TolA-binding protein